MENRKKIIIKLSIVLVVVLLALTFFSNTLLNINVAGVVVGFESDGLIRTTFRGHGILEYSENFTPVFAEHTGQIQLLVDDGDVVDEEDPLFEVHYKIERNQILNELASAQNRHYSLPLANVRENNAEIQRLQELLAGNEGDFYYSYIQTAPYGGKVHLADFLEVTNRISEGQAVLNLSQREGEHFVIKVFFSENFVAMPRDDVTRAVRISVPVLDHDWLDGEIVEVTSEGGRVLVKYHVNVPYATGGERTEVFIEDLLSPPRNGHILPNYAIRQDSEGDFILVVRREENRVLGYSYFAERVSINIVEQGDSVTSFRLDGGLGGPIILQSDRFINDGSRIRMVGER